MVVTKAYLASLPQLSHSSFISSRFVDNAVRDCSMRGEEEVAFHHNVDFRLDQVKLDAGERVWDYLGGSFTRSWPKFSLGSWRMSEQIDKLSSLLGDWL